MVVEYYKTPKGHCYKKNKEGCKRISKEDYNKAIKKGKEEGGSKKNKKEEKRRKVKIDIKYQKKTNKKGQKYYQKIDKTGKKIRISKNVYEKNALKGGVGEKRKTPNTSNTPSNLNEREKKRAAAMKKTCLNVSDLDDNTFMPKNKIIINYLKEDNKNFVTRLKLNNGEYRYFCHNYNTLLKSLDSDEEKDWNLNNPNVNLSKPPEKIKHFHTLTGQKILKEYYACKEADQRLRPTNIIYNHLYIKIYNGDMLHFIKKPFWINTGLPTKQKQRIFDIKNTGRKIKAYVSAAVLFSNTPVLESAEHCNQLSPEIVYELVPLEPHPRPSTPPPRPRPTAPPPINRNRGVRPFPELNADGFITRRRRTPRASSTSTPSSQGPSPLPPFLRSPSTSSSTSPTTSYNRSTPSILPPFLRSPSTSNIDPRYIARRTNPPTRVARSGQSAYSTRPSTTTRPRTPTTPQSSSSNSQSSNDYNSNATTEEN